VTRRRAYAMRIQSIEEHRVIWGMLAKGRGNVMAETNFQYAWSDADAYEAFMGRWSELLAPIFIDFTGIAPDVRVLDVACGTGVLSKALAEAGASVVGVDASAGYLAGARSHRSHPNVTYEECDIRRMQFADNAFDAAVSTLALDVLPEIEQVVSEMQRVTRPGGIVASAVHQFLGGMTAFDLVINTTAVLDASIREVRDARAGREQFWPEGQAALWRKIGLAEVAEIPVVVDCEYRSFADYWATFMSGQGIISRYLIALPDDVLRTAQEHVRGGYLLGQPDGPRSFPMMFRAVRGVVPTHRLQHLRADGLIEVPR
jgi:2-polyprenyl-3-methyl-5-hydroxy-6-metoxy-1,4-benzoquinol methylase